MITPLTTYSKSTATHTYTPQPLPKQLIDPQAYFSTQNIPQNNVLEKCRGDYDTIRKLVLGGKLDAFAKAYINLFKSCGEQCLLTSIQKNDMVFFHALIRIGINLAEIDSERVFHMVNNAATFEVLLQNGFKFKKYNKHDEERNSADFIMIYLYHEWRSNSVYWNSSGLQILLTLFRNKLSQDWTLKDFHLGINFAWEVPEVLDLLKEMNALFKSGSFLHHYKRGNVSPVAQCLLEDPHYILNAVQYDDTYGTEEIQRIFIEASMLISIDLEILDKLTKHASIDEKEELSLTKNDVVDLLLWAWTIHPQSDVLVNLYRVIKHHSLTDAQTNEICVRVKKIFDQTPENDVSVFWDTFSLLNHQEHMPGLLLFMQKINLADHKIWDFINSYVYPITYYDVKNTAHFLDMRYVRSLVSMKINVPYIKIEYKQMFRNKFLQIIMQYGLDESIPDCNREYILRQLTISEFCELIEAVAKSPFNFSRLKSNLLEATCEPPSDTLVLYNAPQFSKKEPSKQFMKAIAKKMNVSVAKLRSFEFFPKEYPIFPYLLSTESYKAVIRKGFDPLKALAWTGFNKCYWKDRNGILLKLKNTFPIFSKFRQQQVDDLLNGHGINAATFKKEKFDIYNILLGLFTFEINSALHISDPFLSLLVSLLYSVKPFDEKLDSYQIKKVFKSLTTQETLNFIHYLFSNPDVMAWLAKEYLYTTSIVVKAIGRHENTFYSFLFPLLDKLPMAHIDKNITTDLHDSYRFHQTPSALKVLDLTKIHFKRLNRTLIETTRDAPFVQAFKICKIGESGDEFCKEFPVTDKCQKVFQSHFHYPIGVYLVNEIKGLPKVLAQHSNSDHFLVYHYVAAPPYFLYLHDTRKVKEPQYQIGRKRLLQDTVKQQLMGIYPFLADMYHNQTTNRPYFALRDILLWAEHKISQGTGRLEAWEKGIRYPNARASGAADMADAYLLKELLEDPALLGSDFPTFFPELQKKVCIQTNELAKLMLIDTLILSYRKRKENKLNWKDEALCQSLADELVKSHAMVMQFYLSISYQKAVAFVKRSGIDWLLAARQISFWLVPKGENGYARWVEKNQVPEGLYNSELSKTLKAKIVCKGKNFDGKNGYSTFRGTHDIGPFNGTWGIAELERAWALLTFMCLGMKEYFEAEKVREKEQSVKPARKRRKMG